MVLYRCDACKQDITIEQAAVSLQKAVEAGISPLEHFCSECIELAPNYWLKRVEVIQDMANQTEKRLVNLRRVHFNGGARISG